MLHMLVATHTPDMCAAVVPKWREKALAGFKQMDKTAKALGISMKGSWTNMPAHTIYVVCDAPNAHVVNQLASEMHLVDWNTVVVTPVISFEEAMARLQQASK